MKIERFFMLSMETKMNKLDFLKKNYQSQELLSIAGSHFCFAVKYKKLQYIEKDFSLIFQSYYRFLEKQYKISVSDIISPIAKAYLSLLAAQNTESVLFRIISNFKHYNNPKLKPEIEKAKLDFLKGTDDIINQYNNDLLLVDSEKLNKFETALSNSTQIGSYVIFEKHPEFFNNGVSFDYNKETKTNLFKLRMLLAIETFTIKNYFNNDNIEEKYQISVSENDVILFNLFLNIYYNDRDFINKKFSNIEYFVSKNSDVEEFKQFYYNLIEINRELKRWRLVDKVFNEPSITIQDVSMLAKQYNSKTSIIYLALYFSNEIIKNKYIWLEESILYKEIAKDMIIRRKRIHKAEIEFDRYVKKYKEEENLRHLDWIRDH